MYFVDFVAHCQTRFGETAYICGNSRQLGQWVPQNGVRLYTDIGIYPKWQSYTRVSFSSSKKIQFKICFVHSSNAVRWESIQQNRALTISSDCKVEINEGTGETYMTRCRFRRPVGQRRMWQILQEDTEPFHYTTIEHKYKTNIKRHMTPEFNMEKQVRARREVFMA